MNVTATNSPGASLIGSAGASVITVGGGPSIPKMTGVASPIERTVDAFPNVDVACGACCRREDRLLAIERRSERQRIADQQVLAQMAAAFAASRP